MNPQIIQQSMASGSAQASDMEKILANTALSFLYLKPFTKIQTASLFVKDIVSKRPFLKSFLNIMPLRVVTSSF